MTLHLETCQIDLKNRTVWREESRHKLSLRECGLLKYLSERPNQVIERDELYREVYHYRKGVRTRTLDVAMIRLRRKVEKDARQPSHLISVYGSGYMFAPMHAIRDSPPAEPLAEPFYGTNLPHEWNPFFGRHEELQVLERLMAGHRACVTILGPPGTGKTRFVQTWARRFQTDNPETGVVFCDFRTSRTEMDVLNTSAVAFGMAQLVDEQLQVDALGQRLGKVLKSREQQFVLIDNAETSTPWLAKWVTEWSAVAEEARFLVTSQVPLGVPFEQRLNLQPLNLSQELDSMDVATLRKEPAMALFVDRAQAVSADFELTDANRDDIVAIVQGLDGLPLAIELAASRMNLMAPAEIAGRLNQRFKLLKPSQRNQAPATQRSLATALDGSWELLEPWEQAALGQCSVFRGGFGWDAVEGVIELPDWPDAPWTLDVIAVLIERSLIQVVEIPQQPVRLQLLTTIQSYSAAKLDQTPNEASTAAHLRHALHFAALGYQCHTLKHRSSPHQQLQWRTERDNLWAALQWAADNHRSKETVHCLRGINAMSGVQSSTLLHSALGKQLLGMPMHPEDRVGVLCTLAELARQQTEFLTAEKYVEAAISMADDLGELGVRYEAQLVHAKLGMSLVRHNGRPIALWEKAVEQLVRTTELMNDEWCTLLVQIEQGGLHLHRHQTVEAKHYISMALKAARVFGSSEEEVACLNLLAITALEQGEFRQGMALFHECLEIGKTLNSSSGMVLHNLSVLCFESGRVKEAHENATLASTIFRREGNEGRLTDAQTTIASCCMHMGQFERALENFRVSCIQLESSGRLKRLGKALRQFCALYYEMGQYELGMQHSQKALVHNLEHEPENEWMARYWLGCFALRTDQLAIASEHFERIEEQFEHSVGVPKHPSAQGAYWLARITQRVVKAARGEPAELSGFIEDWPASSKQWAPHLKGLIYCRLAEAAGRQQDFKTMEEMFILAQQVSESIECFDNYLVTWELARIRHILSLGS